jgi:hypothetical protein
LEILPLTVMYLKRRRDNSKRYSPKTTVSPDDLLLILCWISSDCATKNSS